MSLTQPQISQLAKDLVGTLNEDDLKSLVAESTGDELYVHWVGAGKPLEPTVRDLVQAMEREGATRQFLAEVYRRRPNRNDVRLKIVLLYPEIIDLAARSAPLFELQQKGAPGEPLEAGTFAPGLQRNIKPHLQNLDIGTWALELVRTQRRVCRVEINGTPAGTGFLVGREAVLTNWHVVEGPAAAGLAANIACRFDYAKRSDGGREEGTAVSLDANGIVHHQPYAPAETTPTPDTPSPGAGELDFALLKLARPIGADSLSGEDRGWLELPSAPVQLEPGAALIIVQHPDGGPMKLAIDTEAVLPLPPPPDRPRLRYATNTAPGSSGSPCLTMEWKLVALHHFGDPTWKTPVFNQGIPAHLIRADIVSAGHAPLLG